MVDVVDDEQSYAFIVISIVLLTLSYIFRANLRAQAELDAIPVVGFSQPFLLYITATRFLFQANDILREGYQTHPEGIFRVATWTGWRIFVCGTRLIEEMRMQSSDLLSSERAAMETTMTPYTLGLGAEDCLAYHKELLLRLTRLSHDIVFAELNQGAIDAFDQLPTNSLNTNPLTWTDQPLMSTSVHLVSYIWSRMTVGLPLQRRLDYVSHCQDSVRTLLRIMPAFSILPRGVARPFYLNIIRWHLSRALNAITSGLRQTPLDVPADYLACLLSDGWDSTHTPEFNFLLYIPIFSMVPLSLMCYEIMKRMIEDPACLKLLRKEVNRAVKDHEWSQAALDSMITVDSFVKESLRLGSYHSCTMSRKAMKPFTFSNGVTIPSGFTLSVLSSEIHHDPRRYTYPNAFDPLRSVSDPNNPQIRHQLVHTSSDFLAWGHGPDACPGRFLASSILKLVVARLVYDYDLRLDEVASPRRASWFETTRLPDFSTRFSIRKRVN
ncbi:hypothetical protein ONZ45_g8395 [Pleurotus djamor]|nr:hypothetical protein ONZ45_g8395 [Pleurotus djamor]